MLTDMVAVAGRLAVLPLALIGTDAGAEGGAEGEEPETAWGLREAEQRTGARCGAAGAGGRSVAGRARAGG